MNNLFVEFVNRLEKMSGEQNLCEAVLQGYLACHPIFEDAEGRASSKTRDFIRTRIGEDRSSEIARDERGKPILTASGKEQTVVDYFEHQIRDMFFHNEYANIKFEPGVARIVFDDIGMERENYDVRRIETLKGILKIISSAHAEEYDANLNGMSFDELSERFGENMKTASEEDYRRVSSAKYERNNDYEIVEIPSFAEAKKYYRYTNPESRWCITHMENMWDTYTASGRNRVYFVLKKGFKTMKPVVGDGCPLDEYGLSMICVIVTNDENDDTRPSLCICTCRWNHDNGGSDNIMDTEQISNVIGESFYKVFKPFSLEELHSRGIYTTREKFEKYNETHDRNLFDWIDGCIEGFTGVGFGKKWNFIDKNGEFLWKKDLKDWFDGVDIFHEGYAMVRLDNKYNWIGKDGKLLWKGEKWFDDALEFEGYARVELNGKWNFINKDGKLLWKGDEWFDDVHQFYEGYAAVKLNGKYNFIDKDGNLLWKGKKWFDEFYRFYEGYARVKLNGKWYRIDKEGNLHGNRYSMTPPNLA